jgi:hypothetical protein
MLNEEWHDDNERKYFISLSSMKTAKEQLQPI